MYAKARCAVCDKEFILDFGTMPKEDAIQRHEEMKKQGIHCPAHSKADACDEAVEQRKAQDQSSPTDEDHILKLQDEGRDMVDGGCKTVPQFNLPSIHGIPGLVHLGFGEFCSDTHTYIRRDSPRGTRFYERVERQNSNTKTGT
jgi:hypothetical protein